MHDSTHEITNLVYNITVDTDDHTYRRSKIMQAGKYVLR